MSSAVSLPPLPDALEPLLRLFREGKRTGLARAISVVEDEREGFQPLLHEILSGGLQAVRVGMTGPPGAGKSTLVAAMATAYRERGEEVGVVAVDPTSPYSGGALLGDRIRMNDLATDPGIFIRSMATRGSLGGLATTTREVIDLMDAFGFPRILVETVGVGQSELEITGAADTVVVVLVPESGDAIQAMKAGLMEIADIFVVNKADRPGSDRLAREIRQALHLRAGESLKGVPSASGHHGVDVEAAAGKGRSAAEEEPETPAESAPPSRREDRREDRREGRKEGRKEPRRWEPPEGWQVPVLTTVGQSGDGIEELLEAVDAHRAHLVESGELEARRKSLAERRIRDVVERELVRLAWRDEPTLERLRDGLEAVAAGEETPYSVARGMVVGLTGGKG